MMMISSPRWIPRLDRRFEKRRFRATFEFPRLHEQATFLRPQATFRNVHNRQPEYDCEGTNLESWDEKHDGETPESGVGRRPCLIDGRRKTTKKNPMKRLVSSSKQPSTVPWTWRRFVSWSLWTASYS